MKLLIQRRRSYLAPLLVILLFCVCSTAGWIYVQDLQARHNLQINDLSAKRGLLLEDYRLLLIEKREAEQKVNMLQQTHEVDSHAYSKVSDHLKILQKEIVDLDEEVTFYREIVETSGTGYVNIKHFAIKANDEAGSFHYQLVLTRGTRSDKVAKGIVKMTVEGAAKGQQKRLGLQDLGTFKAQGLDYEFKYFQRLEGRLSIPEGFSPQRIIIKVSDSGKSRRPLLKSFEWSAINS